MQIRWGEGGRKNVLLKKGKTVARILAGKRNKGIRSPFSRTIYRKGGTQKWFTVAQIPVEEREKTKWPYD